MRTVTKLLPMLVLLSSCATVFARRPAPTSCQACEDEFRLCLLVVPPDALAGVETQKCDDDYVLCRAECPVGPAATPSVDTSI
jgi:hypothetical protein